MPDVWENATSTANWTTNYNVGAAADRIQDGLHDAAGAAIQVWGDNILVVGAAFFFGTPAAGTAAAAGVSAVAVTTFIKGAYSAVAPEALDWYQGYESGKYVWVHRSDRGAPDMDYLGADSDYFHFSAGHGVKMDYRQDDGDANYLLKMGGTYKSEVLSGSKGTDYISGGDGRDLMHGMAGNDTINGGDGDDIIFTETGTNTVTGGAGHDTIFLTGANRVNLTTYDIVYHLNENDSVRVNGNRVDMAKVQVAHTSDGEDTRSLVSYMGSEIWLDGNYSRAQVEDMFA